MKTIDAIKRFFFQKDKLLTYDEIKSNFNKNDKILSLEDGKIYTYSGFLTRVGTIAYDSFNDSLVVYKSCKLAIVSEKGVDYEALHIQNVINTRKRLGCTNAELLKMDYMSELGYK